MLPYCRRWFVHLVVPIAVFLALLLNFRRTPRAFQRILVDRPSLCTTASIFKCEHCIPKSLPSPKAEGSADTHSEHDWSFNVDRDGRNYGLTDAQCDVAFPGLFEDIDLFISKRKDNKITKEELARKTWPKATLRAMVYDNELYVIDYTRPQVRGIKHEATLHALHRAIITSPSPLPNAEFAITVDDYAQDPNLIWSYTRTAEDEDTWLMPDFGFWGWGETGTQAALGSWSQVRRWMREVENKTGSFSEKVPKAFWRGEVAMAETLRSDLLANAEGKPWADVKHVRFAEKQQFKEDAIPLHQHCRYMFLIHAEGNSYSGRLKHLQNCHSVVIAPTFQWIQPFQYLMVSSGPNQNYVEIKRDFSDLEEKVMYYLEHQDEAERIANNNIATFRDRYLTPAAETCYWRKLIRGWREVSFEPEFYDDNASEIGMHWRGTPFENYALRRRLDFLREEGKVG